MKKQSINALGMIVLAVAVIVFIGVTIIRPMITREAVRITVTPTGVSEIPLVGIIAVTLTPTRDAGCNTGTCVPPRATNPPPTRIIATRDPNATPIDAFQILDQQVWPAEGEFVDWTQPLMFGQYIQFATPMNVDLMLIAFPIYADEQVPTPNGCYADDGKIPTGAHRDRPFWSDGVTIPYPYGEGAFEHVYEYSETIPGATHLISWLIVRGEDGGMMYCNQQVIELPTRNG